MSCTLSAETYVSYLFILEVVTGRRLKYQLLIDIIAENKGLFSSLRERNFLRKFLEQHMIRVTYHQFPGVVNSVTSDKVETQRP